MNDNDWIIKRSKTRPRRGYIWNDVYYAGLLVVFGASKDQFRREYLAFNKGFQEEEEDFTVFTAKFLSNNGYHCIAFKNTKPSPGIIAHEALHYTNLLLEHVGVKTSSENDEAHAYLLQWVVDGIHDLTKNKK